MTKDPCQRVYIVYYYIYTYSIQLSDSSEKEAACRLFGLASTIVEGSFYGMSVWMAKRKKKFISFWKEQHTHILYIKAAE